MYEYKKPGSRGMFFRFCCGFLILGFAACNLPGASSLDPEAEATKTPEGAQDVELGQQEQALKKGECPRKNSEYELLYDHELVLNSGDVGDISYHFEWEEEQHASFYFLFDPSGKVNNKDEPKEVTINVSGWLKTGDDECPIAYFQGAWPLTADIQGTCKKGIVKLHVTEHFEDVALTSTCGGVAGPGPGLYSAPEVDLTFDLSIPMTNDGIMSGSRDSMMYLSYWYELKPFQLEPVPIPTP